MPQLRLILVYSGLLTFTKVIVRLDEIDSGLFWFTYRHSFKSCHLDFYFPVKAGNFVVFGTFMLQLCPNLAYIKNQASADLSWNYGKVTAEALYLRKSPSRKAVGWNNAMLD